MRTLRRVLLLAMIATTVSACSKGRKNTGTPLVAVPASLRVESHHWLDVVIYAVHDGQRTRLGMVPATKTTGFTIPASMLGQVATIQLIADPVGANASIASDRIAVRPGTRLVWTLESDLARSALTVY